MTKLRYELLAEKLQIKRYFLAEYKTLYYFGFDLDSKEKTLYRPWISLSSMFLTFVVTIGMIHYSYLNIQELDKVADALSPCVQVIMALWKYIILVQKRKDIVDLVHQIWQLTENAKEAELKILARENRTAQTMNLTYCGIMVITVFLAAASPPFVGAFNYMRRGEFNYNVTLTATYPLKLEDPVNYSIIYAWNLYVIFGVVSVIAGLDTVYSWIIHNIAAQFCVLQFKLDELSAIMKGPIVDLSLIRKNIVNCIQFHQRTITLANSLDGVFRSVAFVEYSMNSTQICLLAFQIGRGIDISRVPFLIFFLLTILMQILLYSNGGQHLEDESERVAITAYKNIQWKFWSVSERKMMLLTILRAQKSCKMTAYFFEVNMRSFVTVIRTAASYVTLLWSVSNT